MNGPFSTIAVALSAVFGFSVVWTLDDIVAPPRPVMIVHDIEVFDGNVRAERTVSELNQPMDWDVKVFREGVDAPVCSTIRGPEEHQGWSNYKTGYAEALMSFDVWVGEEGCYERLNKGDIYGMTVVWTPRDGRDAVSIYVEFLATDV